MLPDPSAQDVTRDTHDPEGFPLFRLDIEPPESEEDLENPMDDDEFPKKPPFRVAAAPRPSSHLSRDEIDRRLLHYLDRAPEESERVQKMFTRVLDEVADLKQEFRDEMKGVKARVSILEIGHSKFIEREATTFVQRHLSERPGKYQEQRLEKLGELTPAGGIKFRPEDIEHLTRKFAEQEARQKGAQEAMDKLQEDNERKAHEMDRLWKRAAIIGSAAVTLISGAVYFLTHILHL